MKGTGLSHTRRLALLFATGIAAVLLLLAGSAFADSVVASVTGEYAPGEALVLMKLPSSVAAVEGEAFEAGISASASALAESVGANAVQTYGAIAASGGTNIVHIKSYTVDTQQLIASLVSRPDVISASPNYVSRGTQTPDDPLFGNLWGMKCINAPAAWDLSTGTADVIVAVIDSGIDRTHEDLSANVIRDLDDEWGFNAVNKGRDPMDDHGHGTHVAGIIGAAGNNGKGVAGVCWKVGLLAVKVLDAENRTFDSQIIAGIDYVLDQKSRGLNIRAANMSITGWRFPIADQEKSSYGAACKALSDAGIVLVVAAGNEGQNLDLPEKFYDWQKLEWVDLRGQRAYPACFTFDNMITVAAMSGGWEKASYSNYSPNFVHIAAPGSEIVSTLPGNRYDKDNGTSMAAPHVTGAAALIAAQFPKKSAAEIKARILNSTALNANWTGRIVFDGFLDVASALRAADPRVPVKSIVITPDEISLTGKTTVEVAASVLPKNAEGNGLVWLSCNPSVAVVEGGDAGAKITSLADGRATIKAYNPGSGKTAYVSVVVRQAGPVALGESEGCAVTTAPAWMVLLAALVPLLRRRK